MTTVSRLLLILVSVSLSGASAQTLKIDTTTKIADVSPTLYGLMTEEINYSYDGGLYAEMVRNRTFQQTWSGFDHWRLVENGSAELKLARGDTGPSTALPHSVKLAISAASPGNEAGLANE